MSDFNNDSFRLDGTFNPSFLTQGPDFIGGDGPLFAMLSASYLFGEAAAAPVAAPTAEEQPMNNPPREQYRPAPAPQAPPAREAGPPPHSTHQPHARTRARARKKKRKRADS